MQGYRNNQEKSRSEQFWQRTGVWIPLTLLCVFLWGTAFPFVKSGYRLFQIESGSDHQVFSLILFAGVRFALCGLITLIFTALFEKQIPLPKGRQGWLDSFLLAIPQTIFQYSLFFIGMANTSGTIGSILASTSSFMAIVLSGLFFKDDKLSPLAIVGCIFGLLGVIIVNISSGNMNSGSFHFLGEGSMLLSSLASALGLIFSKKLTLRNQPRILSGWNFLLGGLILTLVGFLFGGKLRPLGFSAWLVLIYLAMLSAIAFSLWTTLLKYHKVSKVSVYKSLIPLIGTIGSALILKENILQLRLIIALILVVIGIILVNQKDGKSKDAIEEKKL